MKWIVATVSILFLLVVSLEFEATGHQYDAAGNVGIVEKSGQIIPPDLIFRDENGRALRLGDLTAKPVILSLVYYTCEHICPQVLLGMARVVSRVGLTPGRDFSLVTVSFDETDTPAVALRVKENYMKAAGPLPEGSWKFLTGSSSNIAALTGSLGFSFKWVSPGFTHPVVLVILAPGGKISRYIYVEKYQYSVALPVIFSPVEMKMALQAAATGGVVSTLKTALLYCFAHEPEGQGKFFNMMAIVGLASLLMLAAFFLYLRFTSKRFRRP